MAVRNTYTIVGRYMDGKEVVAYHLTSDSGKSGRYTREQVIYLVGRGQILNCTGQIYQDKLLLRGKGIELNDLPVMQEDGRFKAGNNIGHVRRNTSAVDAMEQVVIVSTIKDGNAVVGYIVKNAGGQMKSIARNNLIQLAKEGKIGNARVQMYQGRELLRGVNCDLSALPSRDVHKTEA